MKIWNPKLHFSITSHHSVQQMQQWISMYSSISQFVLTLWVGTKKQGMYTNIPENKPLFFHDINIRRDNSF